MREIRTYGSERAKAKWLRYSTNFNPDWECLETVADAFMRAADLAYPGESFTLEEVSEKCPLLEKRQAISSGKSF